MATNRFQQGPGPSQRQLRVGELIRRTLSDVLMRGDVHDPDLNRHSITVGEVRCSPDLKIATAYVLPLGGQRADEALAALRRNTRELRHLVAKAMTLKYAPDLRFQLDETFDRMDDTRRMFADERVRRDMAGEADQDADRYGDDWDDDDRDENDRDDDDRDDSDDAAR
ncbi:30S ribosome-binding factor RbfA [Paracoccus pacificus]|uniref:Ribosome-binding factor A n=1 Tax=Paracoccus pacificus TaxID=1463598 RepID=A0ABW4RDG3_9RHOB